MKAAAGCYDENAPICEVLTRRGSVMADGQILPCAPLAGYCEKAGIQMENVKTQGLQAVLCESSYLEAISHTVREKRQANAKCGSCPYFEDGWYERFCDVLDGWDNLSPMGF